MNSMTLQDLLNRIRAQQDSFSAAQQLVAAYVLENYHQIPFLSITALSEGIGVSDNTVVKFCNRIGFDRFAEFKKFISDYVSQYSAPELIMSKSCLTAVMTAFLHAAWKRTFTPFKILSQILPIRRILTH